MAKISASDYNNLIDSLVAKMRERDVSVTKTVTVSNGERISPSVYDSSVISKQTELAYIDVPFASADIPVAGSVIFAEYYKRIEQIYDDFNDGLGCVSCIGACTTSCKGVCKSCSGGCGGTNYGNGCTNGCTGWCSGGFLAGCGNCTNTCSGLCGGCRSACDRNCSTGCSTGCKTTCKTTCENSCQVDCSNSSRYGTFQYHS